MKRINKIVLTVAVALIAVAGLGAATWVWSTPYDNVTGYRYQIGSESEDGWVEVGKDVTSLTIDSKEETTLYVQLTVDNGRFWSPSGIATYVPQSVPAVENLTNQDQNVVDGVVIPTSTVSYVAKEEAPETAEADAVEDELFADEPLDEETEAMIVDVEEPAEETVEEELPAEEPSDEEAVAVIGGADEPTDIVVTDEELPEDEYFEEEIPAEEEEFIEGDLESEEETADADDELYFDEEHSEDDENADDEYIYYDSDLDEENSEEEIPADGQEFTIAEPIVKKGMDFRFGMDVSIASEIGFKVRTASMQPVLDHPFKVHGVSLHRALALELYAPGLKAAAA